jgi:hypothetical protein
MKAAMREVTLGYRDFATKRVGGYVNPNQPWGVASVGANDGL